MSVRYAMSLAAAAIMLAIPASASAAETVINFDEQPVHTTIAGQYAAQGITFDERPSGPAELHPFIEAPPVGQAHSAPNVLNVSQGCGGEFPHVELWGRFAVPRNFVGFYIGNDNPALTEAKEIKLQGFDLGGNPISAATDSVNFSGSGVDTKAAISDPKSEISFFQVTSNLGTFCPVGIDDLSFESLPSAVPPDFGLSVQGSGVTLTPGSSVTVTLGLHRSLTSTGPISFGVSGLPSGVSGEVKPNPTSGPDGSSLALVLTASPNAPAEVYPGAKVTVTGTPSSAAGEKQRSVTIPIYLSGSFDLAAQGLEVTQGIQPEAARLTPSGDESGGNYSGVSLVAHKQTAVRLFADINGFHRVGGVPNVGAVLYGSRDGRQLPGSPIYPDFGPAALEDTGAATVSEAERESEANAYTFTLPQSWTESGAIQLVGHVYQEPSFPSSQAQIECSAPSCQADNSFTENGINFQSTQNVMLWPVALSVNGNLPVSSSVAFADSKLVTPLANSGWNPANPNDGFTVLPYQAIIDISDIVNSTEKGLNKTNAAQSRVEELASNMGHPDFGAFGIAPEGIGGVNFNYFGGTSVTAFNPGSSGDNRPLTAVAHELFHMFGLKHASNECGGGDDGDSDDTGQEGVPWPLRPGDSHDSVKATVGETSQDSGSPDEEGFGQLLGIGLDMSSEPYTIRADGIGGTTEYYDFMSYCSPMRGGGDQGGFGNWVSPINWEAVFHNFDHLPRFSASSSSFQGGRGAGAAVSTATVNRRGSRSADAVINPARLRVIGYGDASGFQLTSVGPQVGPPLPAGKSNFTLTARGKQGQVVATAPMVESIGHEDAGQLYELSAEVPAQGVDSIAVASAGVPIASRTRPRSSPRLQIITPHLRARVGGKRKVSVSWRATNPDHQSLTASVDYSRNNGRTWQTVFIGPNTGRASLPGSYLEGSRAALVRVRVNDGFNESVAVSHPFTVLDAPPQVTIAKTLSKIPGDTRLQLQGQAFNQRPSALGGHRLHWFDGPFALGSGTEINALPLPPGKNHIRLFARDAGGISSAHALVTVAPVHLAFLRLKIPKSVPSSARKLVFHAQAAVHAVLTVDGRRFSLGPKAKKLSLPIKSGGSLLLQLAVKANGITTPFASAIRRP